MNALSILLIQSQNINSRDMGTGFVVYSDDVGSYILTCNHVLNAVKEPKINDYEIEIVVTNELYDLALLYVKGLEKKPFILKECEKETTLEKDVSFVGYRTFKREEFRQNKREATILDKGTHKQNDTYFDVWEIIAKEDHVILHGYSGSPLILDNRVIAIMTNKEEGNRGFATTIQCLSLIWKDMPKDLILQEAMTNNPFVGLRAFTKKDSQYFFGRDEEVQEIIKKLEKSRFLAVVGDSGSGKSSIVKAKVIPYYLEKNYCVLEMRPANNPYMELNIQLKNSMNERDNLNILNACHAFCQGKNRKLLIYIDQFEELFTGHDNKVNREEFLEMLLYLHNNETSQLRIEILFTMRSDYYPRLEGHVEFIELIEKNKEDNKSVIQRMEKEQLEETIFKPLTKALIVHEEEAKTFAYFVVKGMLKSKSNEITLLQIALTQTLKDKKGKDLFEAYKNVGGVSRALHTLANETIESIDKEDEIKIVFMRLVNFSKEGNHTRRIAQKNEFTAEQWELIQLLSSALDSSGKRAIRNVDEKLGRLLKLDEKNQTAELVHEALIVGWETYSDWIKEYEHFKPIHDSLMWKTQEYREDKKKKGYLLTGIPLVKASDLLGDEYREFLSEDEVEYIEASQKNKLKEEIHEKKMNRVLKGLVVGLLGLVLVSGYFWYEAKKSEEEVIVILKGAVDGAIVVLQEDDVSNVRLGMRPIVLKFKNSSNIIHQRIVSKAWFVQARALEKIKDYPNALKIYSGLIDHFKKSNDDENLRYVAQSLFNKGVILEKLGQPKLAIKIYKKVVLNFKKNQNGIILEQVAKAWVNKGLLEKREQQLKTYTSMIDFFKDSRNKTILFHISRVYNQWGWLKLLDNLPKESIKILTTGISLNHDNNKLYINLAHAYLVTGKIQKAKQIYCSFKEQREEIQKDWNDLKVKGVIFPNLKSIKVCLGLKN